MRHRHFCFSLLLALSALSIPSISYGQSTSEQEKKLEQLRAVVRKTEGRSAEPVLPYYKDPDPVVRKEAYGLTKMRLITTPEMLLALREAGKNDPDPEARKYAYNVFHSMHTYRGDTFIGLDPSVFQSLRKNLASSDDAIRLETAEMLAALGAPLPDDFIALMKDKDPRFRRAGIKGADMSIHETRLADSKLANALLDVLLHDAEMLDPAGYAMSTVVLNNLHPWPQLDQALPKLEDSPDLDRRAVAAVIRNRYHRHIDSVKPVERPKRIEAMRCHLAWVRLAAAEELIRDGNVFVECVLDPDSGVARDGALFTMVSIWLIQKDRFTTPPPPEAMPLIASLKSPDPARKAQAIETIGKGGANWAPAVRYLLDSFDDPTHGKPARVASYALLRDALEANRKRYEQSRAPSTTRAATTRPAVIRN